MEKKSGSRQIIIKPKVSLDSQILRQVRFLVPAQSATISPPIGPILGQFGINIMDFCKQFNERSKYIEQDTLVFVDLSLFKNKSFVFSIRTPPFSFLVNEESFEDVAELEIPLFIDLSSLYRIMQIKKVDLAVSDVSLMRSLFGTVRSMHLLVCNDIKK
jgi:large subunit ribosomal protein L11